MCKKVNPEVHLCEASATTQMSTPDLLLSVSRVSLCSPGQPWSFNSSPSVPQSEASTGQHFHLSSYSLLSLLEPRVDPGSLHRLTRCLSNECEGKPQQKVLSCAENGKGRSIPVLLSPGDRTQDSRVQHAYGDASLSGWETVSFSVWYSAVAKFPYAPQARGLKTSSVLTIPPQCLLGCRKAQARTFLFWVFRVHSATQGHKDPG